MAGAHITIEQLVATCLYRPCVDCGRYTGGWCDTGEPMVGLCKAKLTVPTEDWGETQATPLCATCGNKWGTCHFCRKVMWCRPEAHYK